MQIVNISPESTKIWQGRVFGTWLSVLGTEDGAIVFQRDIICKGRHAKVHLAHKQAGSWTHIKKIEHECVHTEGIYPELIQCQIGDHPMKRMLFKVGFGAGQWVLWDGYPIIA